MPVVLTESEVIAAIKSGQVGIMSTDTIYGLVCSASNETAVKKLYALKDREHKPGTIIAAAIEQLVELGVKERYLKAVADYWPNSISIEIPHQLAYLNQNTGRQAFRIPKDPRVQTLLQQTGPLLTSSANHPGKPPASNLREAQVYFKDKVDFYLDGGDLSDHQPSTLIRVVDDEVEVLREGAVKINQNGEIV